MAAPCRIICGKSFCVNFLLTSSRNCYFVDSSKFYHQSSNSYSCCVKKDNSNVLVVPPGEKLEGNSQPLMSFSPGLSCRAPKQSNSSLMILKTFSSHNLLNQNSFLMMSPSFEKSTGSDSSVNVKETSMAAATVSKQSNAPAHSNKPPGRPSEEQVMLIHKMLSTNLPRIFVEPADYRYFAKDVIFEDNIRHSRTIGLYHLVKKLGWLRIIGHFKYAYVKFSIIKITAHPEEGCVKVRWRISGVTTWKAMLSFWRIKFWQLKDSINKNEETWRDGFSIFYVNSNGKIQKITVDKLMPDEELKTTKADKLPLAGQLAIIGVTPENLRSLGF